MYIFFEFLQTHLTFYLFSVFFIGLAIGSFLNVVIIRLPIMIENNWKTECCSLLKIDDVNSNKNEPFNLINPASHCVFCKHKIRIAENIPLLSYIFLKGKCSHCKVNISSRYPIVEITSALSACIVAHFFGVSIQAFFAIFLTWALITLSVIDLDTRYLPDDITQPLLWIGILINVFNVYTDINSSILGAIFGYSILWFICIVFKLLTGKIGMGHGDFKLLAVFGAWFGWQTLTPIIILSSIIGIVAAIFLIINKSYNKNDGIPFGPYLAFSGWLSMMLGPYIISGYLNALI